HLALPPWPAERPLRAWQRAAVDALEAHGGDAFLASATPAAGKTTFGLHVAHRMLSAGTVRRVVVVAPTTHICRQWAADAARYGIDLEPNRPNAEGPEPRDRHGITVTYQTVAAGPAVHRRRAAAVPTLLIADEPHHMGDQAAWGQSAMEAFGGAPLKLLLSGTPFRSDNSAIPWVRYDDDGISRADFAYSYTQALLDRVCRPVTFCTYDGDMEWMSDGRRRRADFTVVLPAAEAARRLRTALDPEGEWVAEVLRDADRRLSQLRAAEHADAGGLVIAADKEHAERLAERLARFSGDKPPIVTSDDPQASRRIAAFAAGREPWLVSVLMVSEGVDIPRLRVGVYATAARTELFFRQVVGRFIRRTPGGGEQMSWLFLPSDPTLKRLAATIEEERNHALDRELPGELGAEERPELERGERDDAAFHALSSTARLDDELLQTTAPGDQLGLFGAPSPPPSPALQAFASTTTTTSGGAAPSRPTDETAYERRERLREERQALVVALSRRTGEPYRAIHARVNQRTGAASVAAATVPQLEKGNALLERELAKR
ncbi:MAG TPA: DEAD/DEAH box helicase family protein, partial [Solirubrobacteraceae bacterium]|nr:DEAD/DEAH box helicase family protein [Solirubrobacteraceae bacterium]